MPLNAIMVWTPDTCGHDIEDSDNCIIHLAYDDEAPPGSRPLTYVTQAEAQAIHDERRRSGKPTNPRPQPPAHICQVHASIGANPALLVAVQEENTRKNRTLGEVQEIIPDFEPRNYKWAFDEDRNLEAEFIGVSQSQFDQINLRLTQRFGAGKVKTALRVE